MLSQTRIFNITNSCQQTSLMGQIVQEILTPKDISSKCKPLDLDLATLKSRDGQGNSILKLEDGTLALLIVREFSQSSYTAAKQSLIQWIESCSRFSCNVLRYDYKIESLICNSHITLRLLIEYGDKTLLEMFSPQGEDRMLDKSEVTISKAERHFSKPLQLLNFFKFMLDAVEEQKAKGTKWIDFHNNNIIYFKKTDKYKYLTLSYGEESHEHQAFFCPQRYNGTPCSPQKSTIFSIGMILLSIFLGEDCSDCYNYQNYTFCQSIFQDKIERMKDIATTKGLFQMLESQASMCMSQFDEQIADLILSMTAHSEDRITFCDLKRRYFTLVKKLSQEYEYSHCQSFSRRVLEPLSSRQERPEYSHTKKMTPYVQGFNINHHKHTLSVFSEFQPSHAKLYPHLKSENPKDALYRNSKYKFKRSQREDKENIRM